MPVDSRFQFMLRLLSARLWIKPLGYCVVAIGVVLVARLADRTGLGDVLPDIRADTVSTLLGIISASMLGVATFAVASMVAAYASASQSATPRAFTLIVADEMSQKALSTFIAAFIFSVVSTVAIEIEYYGPAGRFILFVLTLAAVAGVILVFVRWVDHVARLGRMRNTIERIQDATAQALARWGASRSLEGSPMAEPSAAGEPIEATGVGYVQHVDIAALGAFAREHDAVVHLTARPGAFLSPSAPLVHVQWAGAPPAEIDPEEIRRLFVISDTRTFTQDPRFGLIAMAEIAARALSPAVNDPGTAIEIITRYVRLVADWRRDVLSDREAPRHPRVRVPVLRYADLLDDAFHPIARDGAGLVEVAIWVQRALGAICELDEPGLAEAAEHQARRALQRAEAALSFPDDVARVREAFERMRESSARMRESSARMRESSARMRD